MQAITKSAAFPTTLKVAARSMGSQTGTVKWFNKRKGYGFISRESDGRDVFAHQTAIVSNGFRFLEPEETVEFDVVKGDKGEQAVNISGPGGAPLDREYYRSE